MATVDVTVRGGGIFGLSIAWECLRRSAHVQLIETRHIGAGSSGGVVGALAPHAPENWNQKKAFQFESLLMSEKWWANIAAASGQDPGYARSGRLQPLPNQAAVDRAHARAKGAAELWQGQATWNVISKPPSDWAPQSPTGLYISDTLTARIHPAEACAALAGAIRAHGGEISEGQEIPEEGIVVHATGWEGLSILSQGIGRTLGSGVKGQAVLLDHDARDLPQIFADTLHIVPHANGTTAIGSTSEPNFTDPTSTDAALDDIVTRARRICPVLSKAQVVKRWAGVRPKAKSRAPMLGPWPDRSGHYIANGGFKIGFGMAPKVAQVMAELILNGVDKIPSGFRVEDNL